MSTKTEFKAILLEALAAAAIPVVSENEYLITLEKDYVVEVEQNGVYKLLSDGSVVAPFRDLKELCHFIKNY